MFLFRFFLSWVVSHAMLDMGKKMLNNYNNNNIHIISNPHGVCSSINPSNVFSNVIRLAHLPEEKNHSFLHPWPRHIDTHSREQVLRIYIFINVTYSLTYVTWNRLTYNNRNSCWKWSRSGPKKRWEWTKNHPWFGCGSFQLWYKVRRKETILVLVYWWWWWWCVGWKFKSLLQNVQSMTSDNTFYTQSIADIT